MAPEGGVAPSAGSASWLVLNLRYSGAAKVLTPGKYDDKSTLLSYAGSWASLSNSAAYMRSFRKSKVVNNAVNFVIKGDQFNVIYSQTSGFGDLGVYVDGVQVDTISQYSPTALYQQVATISGLTDDLHVIKLKHLSKNVSFDGVEVFAPPDLIPPSDILDLSAVTGSSYGTITLTWTVPGNDGLDGVAKSYDVRYSTAPIDATNWDAATKAVSGVPAPGIPGSTQFMNVSGLIPEQVYYFAIQTLDEPAPDATPSGISNSPSAITSTLGPFGPGAYDDKDLTKWMYQGTWRAVRATSARLGVYHLSSTIGNSAFFKFDGSQFTVIYSKNSAGGIMDVLLDGVSIGQIDQKSSTQKWKVQTAFPVSPGPHMVQLVHLSGSKVYLDAIIIE